MLAPSTLTAQVFIEKHVHIDAKDQNTFTDHKSEGEAEEIHLPNAKKSLEIKQIVRLTKKSKLPKQSVTYRSKDITDDRFHEELNVNQKTNENKRKSFVSDCK